MTTLSSWGTPGYDPFFDPLRYDPSFSFDPFGTTGYGDVFGYGGWPSATWDRGVSGTVPRPLLTNAGAGLYTPRIPRHLGSRIMDTTEGVLWRPSTDVYEDENDIIIHVDLPGVPKEDITIDTTENEITIHGEAKRPGEFVAASSRVRERNIGKFRKIVRLPTGVDMNNVKTKYENGLLEVRVPKGSYSGKRIQLK